MPISTACPQCQTEYNLADQMRGKRARCKKCQQPFTVQGQGTTSSDKPVDVEIVATDITEERLQGPDRPVKPVPVVVAPIKANAGRPAARRPIPTETGEPRKSSQSTYLLIGAGVGLFLLLALGSGLVYYIVRQKSQEVVNSLDEGKAPAGGAEFKVQLNGQELKVVMPDLPKRDLVVPNPQGGLPAVPPVALQVKPQQKKEYTTVDEALADLKANDASQRAAAANWLATTEVQVDRQGEVAGKLEPLINDNNGWVHDAAARALAAWATKDSVPALLKALDNQSGTVKQAAMDGLVRLKDERAAAPLAQKLTNFFERGNASKALQALGPVAEKEVVKYFFDKDGGVREEARKLLSGYNTKGTVILVQAAVDMKSDESDRRRNAVNWVSQQKSVDEENQAVVARALEPLLNDNNGSIRDDALKALKYWGSKANLPAIIRMTDHSDVRVRGLALDTLSNFKEEEAVKAIVLHLDNHLDRQAASTALQAIGPSAEKTVLPYLSDKDSAVRVETCRILGAIGTSQSIRHLQSLFLQDKSKDVQTAATNAINAIEGRLKGKP
jgi:HEAT repeat protein